MLDIVLFYVICSWCVLVFYFLIWLFCVHWFCGLNVFIFLCSWSCALILFLCVVLCICFRLLSFVFDCLFVIVRSLFFVLSFVICVWICSLLLIGIWSFLLFLFCCTVRMSLFLYIIVLWFSFWCSRFVLHLCSWICCLLFKWFWVFMCYWFLLMVSVFHFSWSCSLV
jgi:hypothetical protein